MDVSFKPSGRKQLFKKSRQAVETFGPVISQNFMKKPGFIPSKLGDLSGCMHLRAARTFYLQIGEEETDFEIHQHNEILGK